MQMLLNIFSTSYEPSCTQEGDLQMLNDAILPFSTLRSMKNIFCLNVDRRNGFQ